jgi:hypothetical protein
VCFGSSCLVPILFFWGNFKILTQKIFFFFNSLLGEIQRRKSAQHFYCTRSKRCLIEMKPTELEMMSDDDDDWIFVEIIKLTYIDRILFYLKFL